MSKYEVLFLDVDNTLLDFTQAEKYSFIYTLNQYNLSEYYNLASTYKDINEKLWKDFEKGLVDKDFLVVERFNILFKSLNLNVNTKRFDHDFQLNLSNFPLVIDGTYELLDKLKDKYKLIAISNGVSYSFRRRMFKSGLIDYFDNVITSEEARISKPDVKIFEYACRKSNIENIDKSKFIILGDSLTSDIQGGINFNIDTCYFNKDKVINNTRIKPTYEINNLIEFIDILNKES